MTDDTALYAATNLLFAYSERRHARLKRHGLHFSHYTTAEVAARILLNKNIWLRNASSMNDYTEVKFGSNCLRQALRVHGDRFHAVLTTIRAELGIEILDRLWRADFNHHNHTYIACLSEHKLENDLGTLSMWRAYGGPIAGVALIFNTDFLDVDSDPLACWSSPVVYGEQDFVDEFDKLVPRIESNIEIFLSLAPDRLPSLLFNVLQFAILSAKHVGFQEEREWRIIHCPQELASQWIARSFQFIRGGPQIVYHLPLLNRDGMDLPEIDLRRLLNRIIIGPCHNYIQVASTFVEILRSLGFEKPDDYIRISHIPLRQQG